MDRGMPGGSVMDGCVNGGSEAGTAGEAGVAKQWRGERRSSSILSGPRSNSASFRLFLSRLAGGVRLMAAREVAVLEVVVLQYSVRACRHRLGQRDGR